MKDTTRHILMPLLQSDETIGPAQIQTVIGILEGEEIQSAHAADPEPYLTLKGVAKRLNISSCSLWRWNVPGHDLGGRRKFRLSEVEAYLHSDEMRRRAEELKQKRRQT